MRLDQLIIASVLMANLFYYCNCAIDLQSCIKSAKQSIVVVQRSNSSMYQTLNYSQNIRKVTNPKGFLVVKSTSDVQVAIKCLVELNLKFAVKCGGHSYEQYSYGNPDDWVIDVSSLKSFEFDKKNLVATVGSGFRANELTKTLWENGKFGLPVGTCGGIGISGFTLGGGIGMTVRKYGLMVDRVEEMEVVTADGNVVRANSKLNSDLFWALRGAGGCNYGIVTKFKFKVFDASSPVITIARNFNFTDFVQYFTVFQRLVDLKLDNSMSVEFACLLGSCSFTTVITSNNKDVRENTLKSVKKIFGGLQDNEIKNQTYYDMLTELDIYTFSYYLKATSFFVSKSLNGTDINSLNAALLKATTGVYLSVNILGGMANVPPPTATAFSHRNSSYIFQFGIGNVVMDPTSVNEVRIEERQFEYFVPEFLQHTEFMNNVESYQNYIDADLPDWLHKYYGDNLPKLTSLKKKYDPKNVFQFKQSIPNPKKNCSCN